MTVQPDEPSPTETPTLDDVIDPTEPAPRDRQEHAKAPERLGDDYLSSKVEHERAAVEADRED